MWTVVNHFGKLSINKLEKEFNWATNKKIEDYYDFKPSEMLLFIEKRRGMFKVNSEGIVEALEYNEEKEFGLVLQN